jgi:pimeloyl-ACP methyl ester carboxylesterase
MPGKIEPPFYPIIYVRGYAGTEAEVEDTVADPYMGFNLGATKVRQLWTSEIRRYYFESPLVRLMKDFDYRDVYSGGSEMPSDVELGGKSIIIYRYYDDASKHLGTGKRSEIEHYAKGLAKLILDVRKRICGDDAEASRKFKVYLVAHSMGGLVCRCFLQNSAAELDEPRSMVDKVFTYATPHNGIDFEVIGNVPGFFSINNVDNFNREKMAKYLGLKGKPENVATLDGKFDPDRLFCLVGTNAQDYDAARGLSRRLVGHVSDGLVRIENAVVSGRSRSAARRRSATHLGRLCTAATRGISASSTRRRAIRTWCVSCSATSGSTARSRSTSSPCRPRSSGSGRTATRSEPRIISRSRAACAVSTGTCTGG